MIRRYAQEIMLAASSSISAFDKTKRVSALKQLLIAQEKTRISPSTKVDRQTLRIQIRANGESISDRTEAQNPGNDLNFIGLYLFYFSSYRNFLNEN